MKKIFTLLAASALFTAANAQVQITINFDPTAGAANLAAASAVHIHSGGATDTNSAWTYVIGEWGNPAAPGGMTQNAAGWSITMNPNTYYGAASNGPIPTGQNIQRIGMVFRESGPCGGFGGNSTACAEQKDATNSDIFVNLATNPPSSSWSGVTVAIASSTQELAGEKLTVSSYPNPFNEKLNIQYLVTEHAKDVKVNIYNMLGQNVRQVVNGVEEAGLHTIEWNATDANGNRVPVGTYFVRYEIDGKVATQKVVLNR